MLQNQDIKNNPMLNIKNEYEDHMRELEQYDNYFTKGLVVGIITGVALTGVVLGFIFGF